MTIQRFAETKADVNVHSTKHPKTPLIEAAEAGIPGNVDAFLFYRADPTIKADGLTAKQSGQRMLDHLQKATLPTLRSSKLIRPLWEHWQKRRKIGTKNILPRSPLERHSCAPSSNMSLLSRRSPMP